MLELFNYHTSPAIQGLAREKEVMEKYKQVIAACTDKEQALSSIEDDEKMLLVTADY